MLLGGMVKNSTLDYPSRLSCVIFTRGCNFHCPYCHNPALVPRPAAKKEGPLGAMEEPISSPDPSEALAFLKKRQGLLDGVVLSGGEPSLQDLGELRAFLGALKKMGYPVKLDTNGSRPEVIEALLKELLVDYLAVDVKAPPGRYPSSLAEPAEAAGVEETIALALDFQRRGKIRCEFRTTCFSPVIDETAVMLIASSLKGSATLYLQEVRPETVLSPGLVEKAGPQPSKALLRLWAAKASAHLPCVAR